jgi:hypothetical protein
LAEIVITIDSDGRVVISLPAPPSIGVVNVPILVCTNNGSSYTTKDINVPCFIGMGHELIHFIHKAEAFQQETSIQDINNWAAHRGHCRAIAAQCYGFVPQISEDSTADNSDSDSSVGLMEFESEDFNKNFTQAWGGTKAYEEFRTIVGKETSTLTRNEQQPFSTHNTEISERHLLSDYFSSHPLEEGIIYDGPPFVTRWTHALQFSEISQECYTLVNSVLSEDDRNHLPRIA